MPPSVLTISDSQSWSRGLSHLSLTATRTFGAIALLVIGGIHYQQYRYASYSVIPRIGPLFLVNFVTATALGLFLLAPVGSRFGHRGGLLHELAALASVAVASSGLAALLISEHTILFGFMEHGYRFVIVLTITSEAVAIAMLTLFLICARSRARRVGSTPVQERSGSPATDDPGSPRTVAPGVER